MTPLRTLKAALLSLFLAVPARTCSLCDPASPVPAPLPQAPFDMRLPAAFTPEEERDFLAAGQGRYTRAGTHFADAKAEPAKHLVTQEAAEDFLKERSAARWQRLSERHQQNSLTAEDRKEALLLYWYRGPFFTPEQTAFLASLNPVELKAPAPARPGGGVLVPPGAGGAPAAAPPAADPLLTALRAQLDLQDHGNAAEKAALDAALARLLTSPTARARAQRLIAGGEKIQVSFDAVPGSQLIERNGKKEITGSGGSCALGPPIHVSLNKNYLGADVSARSFDLPATLGHELLGHGLGNVEAKKQGAQSTYQKYTDNETNAGLVGWVVHAEIGGKLDDGHMWSYLRDPDEYHRNLQVNLPYYAGTFTPAEMADPLPVLAQRKARARQVRAGLAEDKENNLEWRGILDHFVKAHAVDAKSLHSLYESVNNQLTTHIPEKEQHLKDIEEYVQKLIDYYGTADGKKELAKMKADSKKAFFTDAEKDNAQLTAKMETLAKGKEGDAAAEPFPKGQVSWPELRAMLKKDRAENPEHWKKP